MLGMSARWQQPPASPVGCVDQMLMGEIAMEIARVTKWPAQRRPFGNSPVLRQSLSGGIFLLVNLQHLSFFQISCSCRCLLLF